MLSIPYSVELNDLMLSAGGITGPEFVQIVKRQYEQLHADAACGGRVMALALHPSVTGQAFRPKYFDQAMARLPVWTVTEACSLTPVAGWTGPSGRRADAKWLDELLNSPDATLIPFWRDQCLVSGDPPVLVTLHDASADGVVFLGLDANGHGVFATDLSGMEAEQAAELAGADRAVDVRGIVGTLGPAEAATAGYGRGLLHWHRNQRFCGACGAATESAWGGHQRVCGSEACGRLHFPKIEPAVIMTVQTGRDPKRILLARHRGSSAGRYSALAGFVEVGESLEDAVRREVAEETGIRVGEVSYVASQAWPFPSGLMIGFRATAITEDITVDGEELLEARWFTRPELAQYAADNPLGRPDSIDRYLLRTWLAGGDDLEPDATGNTKT